MAKPTNPAAKLFTVQIPRELVGYLRGRSQEMDLSMPQYVARLIREDQINLGNPRIEYPIDYSGPVMELRVAEPPTPHLRKKKSGL